MNKVALIILTKDRPDDLFHTYNHNIGNAGCECDIILVDNGTINREAEKIISLIPGNKIRFSENIGIGNALNVGLHHAYSLGYEYFQFCANDIFEGHHWLVDKIRYTEHYPNSGILSTYHGAHGKSLTHVDIKPIEEAVVVGQFFISRKVVDKIGYFVNFGGLYGPVDCNYNDRAKAAGFINYYVPDKYFSHSLNKVNDKEIYGYDKQEHLKTTWAEHQRNHAFFNENYYVPFGIDTSKLNLNK